MRRTKNLYRMSSGLLAGSLNTKVSLQRRTTGRDELGQPIDTWTEYASVWGSVLQLSGKETVSSGTQVATGAASIRIRYRTDVTNGDRAVVLGQVFNIGAPLPNLATREYVDLPCTSGANAG